MSKNIVITGGGTGGHVFPALAIAEELQKRGNSILYIGSDRGLEARLAPQRGIRFVAIKTGPVKNQSIIRIIKTLFQLVRATAWSAGMLRKEKIDAVVGVGGYISVPVCLAAFLLRRPVYLQEQNVSVGIANRFLGKISRKIFLGFPEASRFFDPKKCVNTGNPIRKDFFENLPPYSANKKTLLVLGGSQGARSINQVLTQGLDKIPADWTIVHQTGTSDAESVKAAYASGFRGKAQVSPFIEDIATAMKEASVVVSRSGAITVSELVQIGRPTLFVPFPRQGQNDQTDNAQWLARQGGAVVVEQGEGFAERFWTAMEKLCAPESLQKMAGSFSALRRPPAIASIGDQILSDLS
ncbi:undecaprenyldiphospho-muramoylpentapeptide beta-N-acetylglucosaminyltransferase [bacterium]|nr:undecaprenyldiphospho-muramoylpentapeptide beta-N-acetylglucosaminyltransferase [bacterium]